MLIQFSIYTYIYIALLASMTVNNVFYVSLLKKFIHDANHAIDWNEIQVEQEGILQVHHVRILDRKSKQLRNRAIGLIKVQWTWYGPKDVTWEHEDAMRAKYPHLLKILEILLMLCKELHRGQCKNKGRGL
jgi:hypothetical protein